MTEDIIRVTQGEFAVADSATTVLSTLLGSCVSCCIWDAEAGVGGMNHILLAESRGDENTSLLSGINHMEVLINALVKIGADRRHLQAKAFGGANMMHGLSDIGVRNANFVTKFLLSERIPLVTTSFGGTHARNLKFWPVTGRVLQKIATGDTHVEEVLPHAQTGHGVELFD